MDVEASPAERARPELAGVVIRLGRVILVVPEGKAPALGQRGAARIGRGLIIISGAFGNYIKKESAMRLGLLPQVSLEKITFCGNAAGAGVSMALLSERVRRHGETLARQTRHIELSMNLEFQDEFMQAMSFSPVPDMQ